MEKIVDKNFVNLFVSRLKMAERRRGYAFFGVFLYVLFAIGLVALYQQFTSYPLDQYDENKV